nr:MAG TPA_asm: Alginate and motility regulator [Caudoviricetes sp.]
MTVSKAQKAATAKYEAKTYDKVLVRLPRGKKIEIESAAKTEGKSVNGFISEAIDEKLQRVGNNGDAITE